MNKLCTKLLRNVQVYWSTVNIDFIKINIIDMFISVMLGLRDTRTYLMKILEVVKITVTVESWYTLSFASLETHWDLFSYTSPIVFTLSTLRLKVETYEEHICRTPIWTFVWEMVEGSSLSCRCYVFQVISGELRCWLRASFVRNFASSSLAATRHLLSLSHT